MRRRDFLAALAALAGGALTPPLIAAVEAGVRGIAIPRGSAGKALSARQAAFVDVVSDLIIPRTATPGASDAGVVGFLDHLLWGYESAQGRTTFLGRLDELTEKARKQIGVDLVSAPRAAQLAFIQQEDADAYATPDTAAEAPKAGKSLYRELKRSIVVGYYTSEPGATRELEYLPVPGGYQPALPLTPDSRNYAT
jgi:hypothetical protein